MKELLTAINAHIQGRQLTEKLIVMSDGVWFTLFYQNIFNPADGFERTATLPYFETTTIQQLTAWVDTIIEKPRD
jgi:hypothetical protein